MIGSLKAVFDELEERKGDAEWMAWSEKMLEARDELGDFVAERRGRGQHAEYKGFLKGSFNFSFHYSFEDDGPDAIVRFPKPGHVSTPLRDEKVINEVQIMEYLRENTTIPIPRIYGWGLTADSPHELGPFIIMDFVKGSLLSDLLKDPKEEKEAILDPNVNDTILDKVYHQIADYLLQISHLQFTRIGAVTKVSGSYSVSKRPLTYNMNEIVTVGDFPTHHLPEGSFNTAEAYFESLAKQHMNHLYFQRNLASSPKVTRERYVARTQMKQLIAEYCKDNTNKGPFIPFCEDLHPSNMIVDPDTYEIKAVIDFEFTNTMPAQFSYDPPWWLLLAGPEVWLDRTSSMDEFRRLFEVRMEQFLTQLRIVEDKEEEEIMEENGVIIQDGPRLSERMRESWGMGQFWFDYAVRRSFEVDAIYWHALDLGDEDDLTEMLGADDRRHMEDLVEVKALQLESYRADCNAQLGDDG